MSSDSVPSSPRGATILSSPGSPSLSQNRPARNPSLLIGPLSNSSIYYNRSNSERFHVDQPSSPYQSSRRRRSHSGEESISLSPTFARKSSHKSVTSTSIALARAQSNSARKLNDSMVYLDGPQIYTCAQCRTHLTSHDEIISKSFHGRHGRAYLFDHCVNVTIGPAEDRPLITGLHSVCDIFCKRCKNMVGWTYAKAYEASQKYKEGKFIIEKINLHLEESHYFDIAPPPGERPDRFRARSISWGSEQTIYEYHPSNSSVDS